MKLFANNIVLSTEETVKAILIVMLVLMATTLNTFNLAGRNLLLVVLAPLLIFLIVLVRYKNFPSTAKPIIFLLAGYMTLSSIYNYSEARLSSFLYSLFFISIFWVLSVFVKSRFKLKDFEALLVFLLMAYLVITILGQLYVLFGYFSPIEMGRLGVIHGWFGTLQENGVFRYYSLSTEPSYAAIIIVLLFSQYMALTREVSLGYKFYWVLFSVVYMLIMFNSGYGFLLFGLFLVTKVWQKRPVYLALVGLLLIISIATAIQFRHRISAVDRLLNIYEQFDYTKIEAISNIDHSASFRVLPFYYYLESVKLTDPHFFFGHGAGVSDTFLSAQLFPYSEEEVKFLGGFLPAYLIDYGITGFLVFALFYHSYIRNYFSFDFIIVILTITNASFNTQLFWLVMLIVYVKSQVLNEYTARAKTTQ
jgi:hypothetical protein